MDFFGYDLETGRIRASRDFWIYVVTFVPLTMLTLGLWFALYRRTKQKREHRQNSAPLEMRVAVH